MIQYIQKFPETYRRFVGWVYTKKGKTPQYLQFSPPVMTYLYLREFFGQPATTTPDLKTENDFIRDARHILETYEHQITGGKPAPPIIPPAPPIPAASARPAGIGLMEQDIIDPVHITIPEARCYDGMDWDLIIAESPLPGPVPF